MIITTPAVIRRLKPIIENISDDAPVRVLFVCLGNICRSPAAEAIMLETLSEHNAAESWKVDSAGTGNYHIGQLADPRMRAHARRRGLELTHRCRQIREHDFEDFDIIIGMDDNNVRNLRSLAPTVDDEERVMAMADFFGSHSRYDHVPDPYYEGAEGFELVLDQLADATLNLYDTVTSLRHREEA